LYADEIIEIWNIKKNYCTISVAYLLWSGYYMVHTGFEATM